MSEKKKKHFACYNLTACFCQKVFASLITKNKSKSSQHTEKPKNRLKEKSSKRMRTKCQNRIACVSAACMRKMATLR